MQSAAYMEERALADAPSQALQQTLKYLSRALSEAFDKSNTKKFPVFKKRWKSRESFRYPQGLEISNSRIFRPRLDGWGFAKVVAQRANPRMLQSFAKLTIGTYQSRQRLRYPKSPYIHRQKQWDRSGHKEDNYHVGWGIHPPD